MRCTSCRVDNGEGARTCRSCGARLGQPSSFPAGNILGEPTAPERREATLLFADVGGYSGWVATADVEEVAEVMQAIKDGACRIVEDHGGMVNQFVGDEVMALFGFPVGHEDDPRRAINAALSLHEFLRSDALRSMASRELTFHTGIATGLVLARSRDVRDGVFDVTGNAVNVAARLRSEAAPGETLIGGQTRSQAGPFFVYRSRGAPQLKGIEGTVEIFAIERRSNTRSTFDAAAVHGLTRYVGRREERTQLLECLEDAARGEARLVTIAGPPGVGKTRLVHELGDHARAREFITLRGQCQSYGDIPPFQPFRETLQDALQLPSPTAPDAAEHIVERATRLGVAEHTPIYLQLLGQRAEPGAGELSGQALRDAVIEALRAVLLALAERAPVLVVVEDWHCADEASDDVFRSLARATLGRPIMAVLTYRSQDIAPERRPLSQRHFELGPFDLEGTAELVGSWLGLPAAQRPLASNALPPGLVEFVHGSTDGNPFFVEEVCHSLVDAGVLTRDTGDTGDTGGTGNWTLARPLEELETPATLKAMVRARIDKLPPGDKELLKLAAVIGSVFSVDLLAALRDEAGPMAPMLDRLEERAHILGLAPRSYRFKHAIIQEVAYNVLLLRRRRELHGRLGAALEEEQDALVLETLYESLAHHYGNSFAHDKALHYAELAGDKAARSFSLDQAGRQYRRAIRALEQLPADDALRRRHVDTALKWAAVGIHNPNLGVLAEVERALGVALAIGYHDAAARCLTWMGWIAWALGYQKDAMAHYRRCLEMATEQDDAELTAQLHANIGMSQVMLTDYAAGRASLQHVLALRDHVLAQPNSGGPGGVVGGAGFSIALGATALIEGDQGHFDSALSLLDEARMVVRVAQRLAVEGSVETIACLVAAMRGDWDACLALAARVREISTRTGGLYQRTMSRAAEGLSRFHRDADPSGLEMMRDAASLLDKHGIGLALSFVHGTLAEALALAGHSDEAVTVARRALALVEDRDALGEAVALRALSIARARAGQAFDAEMARSVEVATKKQSAREAAVSQLRWAELHAGLGREAAAQRCIAQIGDRFDTMAMPWYAARMRALG